MRAAPRLCWLLALVGIAGGCFARGPSFFWPDPRLVTDDPTALLQPARRGAPVPMWVPPMPSGQLSLREVQALVLRNHPELDGKDYALRAEGARVQQAGLIPNPEFAIEFENFLGGGELAGFHLLETTLTLSQLIELGGKRGARLAKERYGWSAASWEHEGKRLELITRTNKAFINLLAAQQLVTLDEETLQQAQAGVTVAEQRAQEKPEMLAELRQAQLVLAMLQLEAADDRQRLAQRRGALARLWGGRRATFQRAVGDLGALHEMPPLEQLEQQLVESPLLLEWGAREAESRAAVRLEQALAVPDLTVMAGFRYFNELNTGGMVAELAIPLPLFARNQGEILATQYEVLETRRQEQAAWLDQLQKLSTAHAQLEAAYQREATLRTTVLPRAREVLESVETSYRDGKASARELLYAQRRLLQARKRNIRALAAYHKAAATVEQLIGGPLLAGPPTRRSPDG